MNWINKRMSLKINKLALCAGSCPGQQCQNNRELLGCGAGAEDCITWDSPAAKFFLHWYFGLVRKHENHSVNI